jgi:formyl-CoA transferase
MKGLLNAMGRPDLNEDPRFATRGARMLNAAAFNEIVECWTATMRCSAVVDLLHLKHDVPAAIVRRAVDVLRDPSLYDRGAITSLECPRQEGINAVGMGNPIQFSDANAQFDIPAETLGQSNQAVYGGILKMSSDQIEELAKTGVI